jgi:hypothetical protein
MLRAADEKLDVNDIIRAIKEFDKEAIYAFEAVARWQEVCIHFDDTPFKPFQSVEQRNDRVRDAEFKRREREGLDRLSGRPIA